MGKPPGGYKKSLDYVHQGVAIKSHCDQCPARKTPMSYHIAAASNRHTHMVQAHTPTSAATVSTTSSGMTVPIVSLMEE